MKFITTTFSVKKTRDILTDDWLSQCGKQCFQLTSVLIYKTFSYFYSKMYSRNCQFTDPQVQTRWRDVHYSINKKIKTYVLVFDSPVIYLWFTCIFVKLITAHQTQICLCSNLTNGIWWIQRRAV